MAKLSSSTRAAELADNYEYCERLLREKDRDLWLACLFAPQEARKRLHALYAFENEISGVREKVTQPLLGEMRLQWWSDLLESPADDNSAQGARAHPVADALLDAIERCGLPRAELLDLIEAHVLDLYDDAVESLEELEYYCDRTVARLMRLAARILSGEDSREAAPIRDAGAALGVTYVLRSLPKHTAGGQMFVPRSILAEFGASETDMRSGVSTPQILAALKSLREFARAKYGAARERAGEAGSARAALLPAALVPIYLDAMERSDYEPFQPTAGPAQWRKQWRLWGASRRDGL
jgi:15-cis-phytoene synthase